MKNSKRWAVGAIFLGVLALVGCAQTPPRNRANQVPTYDAQQSPWTTIAGLETGWTTPIDADKLLGPPATLFPGKPYGIRMWGVSGTPLILTAEGIEKSSAPRGFVITKLEMSSSSSFMQGRAQGHEIQVSQFGSSFFTPDLFSKNKDDIQKMLEQAGLKVRVQPNSLICTFRIHCRDDADGAYELGVLHLIFNVYMLETIDLSVSKTPLARANIILRKKN